MIIYNYATIRCLSKLFDVMFYKRKKSKPNYSIINILCVFFVIFFFFLVCYEVWAAKTTMKLGQAVHQWNFSRHLKTTELIRSQYYSTKSMTGQIPPNISKSIFIALPKKKPRITKF